MRDLDVGREYYLELETTRPFDKDALLALFDDMGFVPRMVSTSPASPSAGVYAFRVAFLATPSRDIELHDTELGTWSDPWPLAITASSALQIFPQTFALEPGITYDMRILAKFSPSEPIKEALEAAGFELFCGPVLLQRHIRHPALSGELVTWIARGLWTKPPTKLSTVLGPYLLEQVTAAKDSPHEHE